MLLAIDTSASLCAAAVHDADADAIIGIAVEEIGRGHAERLMEVIADALSAAGCDYGDLTRIAATSGPGSFTGIRVGLATARGIGLGLSVPVLGISALDAMRLAAREQAGGEQAGGEQPGGPTPLLVAIDARRNEAFCQFYDVTGRADGPFVADYGEIAAKAAEAGPAGLAICGSAARKIAEEAGGDWRILHELAAPPIECVARLGAQLDPKDAPPEPLYIRPPDAKPQANFALQRA